MKKYILLYLLTCLCTGSAYAGDHSYNTVRSPTVIYDFSALSVTNNGYTGVNVQKSGLGTVTPTFISAATFLTETGKTIPDGSSKILKLVVDATAGLTTTSVDFWPQPITTMNAYYQWGNYVYNPQAATYNDGATYTHEMTDGGSGNGFRWFANNVQTQTYAGWNFFTYNRTIGVSTVAAGSWGQTFDTIRLYGVSVPAGTTATFYLGSFLGNMVNKPILCLSFDGQTIAQYTQAYPIFTALGLVGSHAVYTSQVGGGPNLTWANLQTMQRTGWSIHNYGDAALNYSSASLAQMKVDLDTSEALLNANVTWNKTAFYYPLGARNATSDTYLAGRGYNTAHVTGWDNGDEGYGSNLLLGIKRPYAIARPQYFDNAAGTSTTWIAWLHTAMSKGALIQGLFHDFGVGAGKTDLTELTLFLKEVKRLQDAGQLDVLNWTDTYHRLTQ